MKLPCLAYRRLRGDMIEVYKQLSGKYDPRVKSTLSKTDPTRRPTRGNSLKLTTRKPRQDYWKYAFSSRSVKVWNSLPEAVVTAPSIKSFERRLDKAWEKLELKYFWEKVYEYEHKDVIGRLNDTEHSGSDHEDNEDNELDLNP